LFQLIVLINLPTDDEYQKDCYSLQEQQLGTAMNKFRTTLLALLGAHIILHVSRIRVKMYYQSNLPATCFG